MSRLYMGSGVLLGAGVLFFTLSAGAQTWRQDSFGQPRYDPYYRNGQSQDYLFGRVMSDLNQAASRAYLDGHERNHFDEVAWNLQDFQARWSRGHFDTGKLDNAIHNLSTLPRLTASTQATGRCSLEICMICASSAPPAVAPIRAPAITGTGDSRARRQGP